MSNLFYNNGKCVLFIHIPKTGGMSICSALGQKVHGHGDITHFKNEGINYDIVFTIIRNPYGRIVSAYEYLKNGGSNSVDKEKYEKFIKPFKNFTEFIHEGLDDAINNVIHFKPQVEFIKDRGVIQIVNTFFYEDLENAYLGVCKLLEYPKKKLPHLNKGKQVNFKSYYDYDTMAKVYSYYRDDFITFKYIY